MRSKPKMLEVKSTYMVFYNKNGYEHKTIIMATNFGAAEARFMETIGPATILSMSFNGPVCI